MDIHDASKAYNKEKAKSYRQKLQTLPFPADKSAGIHL